LVPGIPETPMRRYHKEAPPAVNCGKVEGEPMGDEA
jgi:hypothetical protein